MHHFFNLIWKSQIASCRVVDNNFNFVLWSSDVVFINLSPDYVLLFLDAGFIYLFVAYGYKNGDLFSR